MKILFFLFLCPIAIAGVFDLELTREKPHDKSLFWGPLMSFILPGSDQVFEEQYSSAYLYGGAALTGLTLMSTADFKNEDIDTDNTRFSATENNEYRKFILGAQLYQTSGSLAAFHSYRSAVKYKKEFFGVFEFLPEEKTDDLVLAPFEFKFFKEKTTYIPLLIIAGLVLLDPNENSYALGNFSTSDAFYTSAYSFNAGVGEEALFRGMVMPNLYEAYGSLFWSNATTAILFGLAHGVKTLPWPQMLVGHYLGWVTQKNQWSLKEAIFIHTWWDIIAIGSQYLQGGDHNNMIYLPLYYKTF